MRGKKAKAIRRALVPGRDKTGMSRGTFVRLLTQYERVVRKRVLVQWPLQVLFGPIPVDYYTQTLNKDCPRAKIQDFKKKVQAYGR
jgi:hypothetical protein